MPDRQKQVIIKIRRSILIGGDLFINSENRISALFDIRLCTILLVNVRTGTSILMPGKKFLIDYKEQEES